MGYVLVGQGFVDLGLGDLDRVVDLDQALQPPTDIVNGELTYCYDN